MPLNSEQPHAPPSTGPSPPPRATGRLTADAAWTALATIALTLTRAAGVLASTRRARATTHSTDPITPPNEAPRRIQAE